MSADFVDWDEARSELGRINNVLIELEEALTQAEALVNKQAQAVSAAVGNELVEVRVWILIALALVLSITGFSYYFARFGIVLPVSSLNQQLDSIALHKDLSKPVSVSSVDEVGTMADSLNKLLSAFKGGSEETISSATVLLTSANRLKSSASQVDDQVSSLGQHMGTLMEAINLLESNTASNVDRSLAAAEAAKIGADQVKTGARDVQKTADSIAQLSSDLDSSAEMLNTLKVAGDRVASVVKTIAEISEQTNLLALNAAIEAARAGESGRGFAVVADEVRALALRTQESTNEINDILATIVDSIARTATSMEDNKSKANESVSFAQSTVVALGAIEETISALSQSCTDLAELASSNKRNTTAMNESLSTMEKATSSVASSSCETRSEADTVDGLAHTLEQSARQFTV
nr:methyl-accepting chemotaxis protein [Marinibactrum halimedae]